MSAEGPAGPPPERRLPRGTTFALLAVLGAIFAALRLWHESVPQLIRGGALYGPLVRHGDVFRLWTHALLHGSVLHLLVNGYALYVLGPATEQLYGRVRFLGFFALCVLGGGLASVLLQRQAVAVGASGGLFGLMAVQAVVGIKLWPRLTPKGRRSFLRSLGFVVVANGLIALRVPNLDHAAHAGGIVVGLLLGAITPLALPWERPVQTPAQQRVYPIVVVLSAAMVAWGATQVVLLQLRPWDYGWRDYGGAGVALRAQRCFLQEVHDKVLVLVFPGLAVEVQAIPGEGAPPEQTVPRFMGRTEEVDATGERLVKEDWLLVAGADVLKVSYLQAVNVPDLRAPPLWELIRDLRPDGGAPK